MFSGVIQHQATVVEVRKQDALIRLGLSSDLDVSDIQVGDSIAINGVCLTVVRFTTETPALLYFDVGPETLQKTTLGALSVGQKVHAEKAMRLSDRLHGHLVQGHVDGKGTLTNRKFEGESLRLSFRCPAPILRLCIPKGSIAIDGISLTINEIHADRFDVCLIPHTLEKTSLGNYPVGHEVNLENDLIGKYVERLVAPHHIAKSDITMDLLSKSGFVQC